MTKLNEAGVKAAIEALDRLSQEHAETAVTTTKKSEGNYEITLNALSNEKVVETVVQAYLAASGTTPGSP